MLRFPLLFSCDICHGVFFSLLSEMSVFYICLGMVEMENNLIVANDVGVFCASGYGSRPCGSIIILIYFA